MCDVESNLKLTWQLISQFVSWEFCRCMSKNRGILTSEVDVLTFFRNMIVERTGNPMSDVTKHEILAKFVMESKSVRTLSRLPCISALSDSVKRICPELDKEVSKLMHLLENFLNALEWNEDSMKREVIETRLQDAVSDFCKEANQVLPVPDLLKLLEPAIHDHNIQRHLKHPRKQKQAAFNRDLFNRVLECLHKEIITASEAKLIAVSLYEDKFLEKIILNDESETETEADSEQFSLSIQSSQPMMSEEFCYASQPKRLIENLPQSEHEEEESLKLSPEREESVAIQPASVSEVIPSKTLPTVTTLIESPSEHGFRTVNKSVHINERTSSVSNEQYLQSSDGIESDMEDIGLSLETRMKNRFYLCTRKQVPSSTSDQDTSDCDKDCEFRFLTPTLFRENIHSKHKKPKTVWLSDSDSNDSSVITTVPDSQNNDPNWLSSFNHFAKPSPMRPAKRRKVTKLTKKKSRIDNKTANSSDGCGSGIYDRIQNGISSQSTSKGKSTVPRKKSKKVDSTKSQQNYKCQKCFSICKSELGLKRHLFLKHPILEDSDCDA